MKTESPKKTSAETSVLTTKAVTDFMLIVGKATGTNADHLAGLAKLFAEHARHCLTMNLFTLTYLRQIFCLCLFNTVLLAWIILQPLWSKAFALATHRPNPGLSQQVDDYRHPIERNDAP
jgi:hypothetical protein